MNTGENKVETVWSIERFIFVAASGAYCAGVKPSIDHSGTCDGERLYVNARVEIVPHSCQTHEHNLSGKGS